MSRQFIMSACRGLCRNKINSIISIASLALGLAIFSYSYFYVKTELSRNRDWPNGEQVHRLIVERRGIAQVPDGIFNTVSAQDYSHILSYFENDVPKATRVVSSASKIRDLPSAVYTPLTFVDAEFSDIFQFEVVQGDLKQTLSRPGFIAFEEQFAKTLGNVGQIGSRVTLEGTPGEIEYQVGAIFRLPENISRSVSFTQLALIHESALSFFQATETGPWENGSQVWISLRNGLDTDSFNSLQPKFIRNAITYYDDLLGKDAAIEDHLLYRWQPLSEIYFNPLPSDGPGGDWSRVITFAAIGALVLLVGCTNSVSLTLISSLERQREVGVHKALGATRFDILLQHLCVATVSSILALLLGVLIFQGLRPLVETLLPFSVDLHITWTGYIWLTAISILVGVAGAAYPAMLSSSVKPQAALTPNPNGITGRVGLRTLLIALQFCLATVLLIATFAVHLQLEVLRSQPLGFDSKNLVYLLLSSSQERANNQALRTELAKIPGVDNIGPAFVLPNANIPTSLSSAILVRQGGANVEVQAQSIPVDFSFFSMMDIPVLAGRSYDVLLDGARDAQNREYTLRESEQVRLVVNRSAARALGFENPESAVDQSIVYHPRTGGGPGSSSSLSAIVIGVVEDNMYMSFYRKPGPQLYPLVDIANYTGLMLKYTDSIESEVQEMIRDVSLSINGESIQNMRFIEPMLGAAFQQEETYRELLMICASITIALGVVGLYGVAAFCSERRIKEVGVRKAMGADTSSILRLFLWQFSSPVLAGSISAWPIAIYFVVHWIQGFPFQLERHWLLPLCLSVTLIVLLIQCATIGAITFSSANRCTANALRHE